MSDFNLIMKHGGTLLAVSPISLLMGDHPVRLEQGARGVQTLDDWLEAIWSVKNSI